MINSDKKPFTAVAVKDDGLGGTSLPKPQTPTYPPSLPKQQTTNQTAGQTTNRITKGTDQKKPDTYETTAVTADDFLRGFNEGYEEDLPTQAPPQQTTNQPPKPLPGNSARKNQNSRGISAVTADEFLRGFNESYEDELPTQTYSSQQTTNHPQKPLPGNSVRKNQNNRGVSAVTADDFIRGFNEDYETVYPSTPADNASQGDFESLQRYLIPGHVPFSDFEEYAQKGAGIENPTLREAEGYANIFGWRPGAKDVGNIVTYSRDNWETILLTEAEGHDAVGRSIYHYMTEDEVDIYNYLLAKHGDDYAQHYLDSLEDELNKRLGTTVAQNIRGTENDVLRTVLTGTHGVSTGLDRYAGGVKQVLFEDELPTSATQYGSEYIRNDLKKNGNGFGLLAYDTVTTLSQMAPNILVSTLLTPAAGAVSQGVSATGNAYKQALSDGYSKEQAENYAVLVGTSEATLQYLLGGISKLGGTNAEQLLTRVAGIDNAIWRVAAAAGVKIGSEVTEEELQLFLEPLYRTLVFGEDYSAPAMEEILYTALLTVTTTGILEGGNIASYGKNINALLEQSKEQIKLDGEKDLQSGNMPDDAHLEIMELNPPTARGMMAIYEMVDMEGAANEHDVSQTIDLKPTSLMDELMNSGEKCNIDEVIVVTKTTDGSLFWLEQGNEKKGLTHILQRHANDFASQGVEDVPRLIIEVLNTKPIKQGQNEKGPYADYTLNGNTYRLAYGTNGYIVSFYPID